MNPILYLAVAVVAISLLSPLMRLLIAAVAGKQVGAAALAKQPDAIHLEPKGTSAWKNAAGAASLARPLTSRGFEDAGTCTVREMPGLVVQLLAHPGDSLYAAVYEHPQVGQWVDVFTRYQDGTSFTVTTAKPTGLAPRPGHDTVHAPGSSPEQVLDRALTERPRKWFDATSAARAVAVFEKAYADSMTYRKSVGVSRREVMNVAMKKKAA